MYIKPLYIYEYNNPDNSSYRKYVITDNSANLLGRVGSFDDYKYFCLTEKVINEYYPSKFYTGKILTNNFSHFRKLTYDETIRYINLEILCEFDKIVKDLINKMILYWDDWN